MVAAAAVALVLASCGGGGSRGGSVGAGPGSAGAPTYLALALRFLPASASESYTFQFADWSAIEQGLGLSRTNVGGLYGPLNKLGSPPTGNATFDLSRATHAIWSGPDVAWDATEDPSGSGAPVSMTGFVTGFQLSAVEHRLTSCGFKPHTVSGVSVYSGLLSAALNCAGPTGSNFPIPATNLAVESQNHVVVMSSSPSALSAALSNQASHSTNPVLRSLTSALLPAHAVLLGVGPQLCTQLSNPAFLAGRHATPQTIARAAHMYLPAAAWEGFGFGYTYARSSVSGRLAFTYADQQTAHTDLPAREHTLRTGVSLLTSTPYAQEVSVQSGQVRGRTAVLQITKPPNRPLLLGNNLDLGFARCG